MNDNNMKNIQKSNLKASLNSPPPLQALQSQQHSENEKNKIPVNVIYRKSTSVVPLKSKSPLSTIATTTTTSTSTLTTSTKFSTKTFSSPSSNHLASVNDGKSIIQMISDYNLNNIDDLSTPYNPALPLTPPSPTLLDQVLNPLHCSTTNFSNNSLLSPTSNNISSHPLNVAYKSFIPLSSVQHKMKEPIKKSIPASTVPMSTPKAKVNISALVTGSKNAVKRRIASSKVNGSNGPTQKKRRTNFFPITLPLTEKNHQNQIPLTAVAVVQHSDSVKFEDSNNLIDPTVLPFCLQAHWLDCSNTKYLLTKSQNREERIANHKSLLRRKALQMLSVRTLQKLPMRLARKRLITVDQLLQKYHDRNILENQDIKSCIVPDCISPAVIMASHCFKHITNNNTQHIFLPCIAKTESNSQCNAPVFNAFDDSPFCELHVHKREEYKRNLWIEQQKARKVTSISSTSGSYTNIYEPRPQLVQHNYLGFVLNKKVEVNRILSTPPRKRKQNCNVGVNLNNNNNNLLGRPQKRGRKPQVPNTGILQKSKHSNSTATIQTGSPLSSTTTATTSTPPPLTVVSHQRKNSTTSLESVASNSHSSSSQSMSMSISHQHQHQHQQQQQQLLYQSSSLPPPALAPLSNHHSNRKINNIGNSNISASDLNQHEIQNIVSQLTLNTMNNNNLKNLDISHSSTSMSSSNVSTSSLVTNNSSNSSPTLNQLISNNQKDELQSILNKTNNSMVNNKSSLNGLNSNGNISSISLNNNLNDSDSKINSNNLQLNGGNTNCNNNNFLYTNNSNSNSSSNFPGQNRYSPLLSTTSSSAEDYLSHGLQDNYHLQSHHLQQQHLQNQQQHIQQYSLQHNPYKKHHDMLSICENSSAYASSEDTGLGGGISEPELMSGTHDVDENPLGDDTLLGEHDMANVLSTLPEDAFNELFNAVQDDECEEVERALELADKHLKSLQQSIGSESDFLSDFFDVNDDFLNGAANDICNKMEIVSSVMHSPDTSGIDTSLFIDSNGSTPSCIADIRDLVQA